MDIGVAVEHNISVEKGFFGGATSWSYSFDDWNFSDADNVSWNWSWGDKNDPDDWAAIGFWGNIGYSMEFGITGEAKVDLGKIAADVAINTNAVTKAGVVDLSGATIGSEVEVKSPDPAETKIDIDLLAKLDVDFSAGGYAWVDGGILGESEFPFTIYDVATDGDIPAIDLSGDLIDISLQDVLDSLDTRGMLEVDLSYATLAFGIPTMEYGDPEEIEEGPLGSVHIEGQSDAFLEAEVDLDSFIGPWFGVDWDESFFDAVFAHLDIGTLDAKLVAGLSFEQSIDFTPDVDVTMVTDYGETKSGSLGDVFEFSKGKEEGEGAFVVEATYTSSLDMHMVTSLATTLGIDWKLLYVDAGITIDIPAILHEELGIDEAMASGSIDIPLDLSFEISDVTYHFDGETWSETYLVSYENDRTTASGDSFDLTTHQLKGFGNGERNTIVGNEYDNKLFGYRGADTLIGNGGDDLLSGGGGKDDLQGGDGSDTVTYLRSKDSVTVDLTDASHNAGAAAQDTLTSIENVQGTKFDDTLVGDENDNILFGYEGVDTLAGGKGDDVYDWAYDYVANQGDVITELSDSGNDTVVMRDLYQGTLWENVENLRLAVKFDLLDGIDWVYAQKGNTLDNKMVGNQFTNFLDGQDGDDKLSGGGATDKLYGSSGDDYLNGGADLDVLSGGAGSDRLVGGAGNDEFQFSTWTESSSSAYDTIVDFTRNDGDLIVLSDTEFNTFTSGGVFTNHAGELISVADRRNAFVYGDVDGDGVADMTIVVLHSQPLQGSDFFLAVL